MQHITPAFHHPTGLVMLGCAVVGSLMTTGSPVQANSLDVQFSGVVPEHCAIYAAQGRVLDDVSGSGCQVQQAHPDWSPSDARLESRHSTREEDAAWMTNSGHIEPEQTQQTFAVDASSGHQTITITAQ